MAKGKHFKEPNSETSPIAASQSASSQDASGASETQVHEQQAIGVIRPLEADNPYGTSSVQAVKKKRRRGTVGGTILGFILVLGVVGALGWFYYDTFMQHFDVKINGNIYNVSAGETVESVLDAGLVSPTPTPGNLLAIDGSLLEEGKGQRASATINGEPAELTSKLSRDDVIEIGNGGDLTEDTNVVEEAIPFEQAGDPTTFDMYYVASIHLLSDGTDGLRRKTTGLISGMEKEEIITAPISAGYHVYAAHPEDKVIALTFDDGPWPETTDAILDILEQYDAKATFFTIGEQIGEYSAQVKRAHSLGCQILTHTWDHASGAGQGVNLTFMSEDEQIAEVQRGYAAIAEVTGEEPSHVFRAPGGNFYGSTIDTLWPYVDAEIGWDIDTEDWRQPGVDAIAEEILSAEPGQVVLMHDGGGDRWQTVEALRVAIPSLVEQGYTFVTIDELLAYGM